MSQTANHPGNLSLSQLESSLWSRELNLYKLTKLEVVGTKTQSTHDNANPVPNRSLVLKLDPSGNLGTPSGTDPNWVVRGDALIGGVSTKVAAFRKTAATASGSAAGSTPAPVQTPTPTPAPQEDGGTGPEGNPNLNSDGTPRIPDPNPPEGER